MSGILALEKTFWLAVEKLSSNNDEAKCSAPLKRKWGRRMNWGKVLHQNLLKLDKGYE